MNDNKSETVAGLVPEVPYPERESDIKKAINNMLWEHGDPDLTLREAEVIACRAFDVIMEARGRKKA